MIIDNIALRIDLLKTLSIYIGLFGATIGWIIININYKGLGWLAIIISLSIMLSILLYVAFVKLIKVLEYFKELE